MQLDYPIGWQSDLAASKKKLKKLGEEYGLDECTLEVGVGSYTRGPFPRLVSLYARMGLHRYNLLQGAKFQLDRVEKYVLSMGSAAPTYGITLDAVDGSSLQSFQGIHTLTEERLLWIPTCLSGRQNRILLKNITW